MKSRSRILALVTASALVALSLAGCRPAFVTGPLASVSPEIADVTAVELDTNGDVVITEGEPSLTITAPEGVIGRLTADVVAGTLVLGRTGGPMPVIGRVTYQLTVPSLEAITVNGSGDVRSTVSADTLRIEIEGSGDVEVTGIASTDVRVEVSGSGDVELSGTAESLTVELEGSGEIDASGLVVRDAVVEVTGSGDVDVHATETLRAEVSGSGDIRYSGSPDVDSRVTGSGDIEPSH